METSVQNIIKNIIISASAYAHSACIQDKNKQTVDGTKFSKAIQDLFVTFLANAAKLHPTEINSVKNDVMVLLTIIFTNVAKIESTDFCTAKNQKKGCVNIKDKNNFDYAVKIKKPLDELLDMFKTYFPRVRDSKVTSAFLDLISAPILYLLLLKENNCNLGAQDIISNNLKLVEDSELIASALKVDSKKHHGKDHNDHGKDVGKEKKIEVYLREHWGYILGVILFIAGIVLHYYLADDNKIIGYGLIAFGFILILGFYLMSNKYYHSKIHNMFG